MTNYCYKMAFAQKSKKPLSPSRIPLKEFDLKVEAFVSSFLVSHGFSPSQREIARALDVQLYSVQLSLKKLAAHGRVESPKDSRRGLTVAARDVRVGEVPLLGTVAAGQPIEAIEGRESIEVPPWMMKPHQKYFVLRVKGRSMIDDQIEDGDLVLIRESQSASNGERVVALIDNEATLKRFERKRGRVLLHPANAAMQPIEVGAHQELRIAGILAGVLRKGDV